MIEVNKYYADQISQPVIPFSRKRKMSLWFSRKGRVKLEFSTLKLTYIIFTIKAVTKIALKKKPN